jgi:hypothetical protein
MQDLLFPKIVKQSLLGKIFFELRNLCFLHEQLAAGKAAGQAVEEEDRWAGRQSAGQMA